MSLVFHPDFAKGTSEIVGVEFGKSKEVTVVASVKVPSKCRFYEKTCKSSSKNLKLACGLEGDYERTRLCVEYCRLQNAHYGGRS